MEFKRKELANGLNVIGEVNRSAKSAAVGFFVKTGSRDEAASINGVSHFLEHMLFKGTEKLGAMEVSEAFDRLGAQFNAATSEENTVFYSSILPEYLVDVTKIWIELMKPALRDEDFDVEKQVIKEEIAMYKDLPSFDVMDRCRHLYFDGHPCGNSVLGREESVESLTAEQMREYFSNHYPADNLVLAVAGNFEWDSICAVADSLCGGWKRGEARRVAEDYAGSTKEERAERTNLACEHICLMSRGVAAQDSRRYAASVLASIVGDDAGSRYFWELVDKALAESASMQFGAMDGTGVFYSYIRCAVENVVMVMNTVRGIFDEVGKNGVSEEELEKAKNKILSAVALKNELPMGRLVDLGFNWVYLGKYQPIVDDIEAIKAVTKDDIGSLIKELKLGEFTQYSLGPGS